MKRRKNIDLQEDTLKRLGFLAVSQGVSVKAYIEQSLDKLAASLNEDVLLLQLSQEPEANMPATDQEAIEAWALLNSAKIELCK